MAGILASVLGGAMIGGGNAWQVQARDQEEAERKLKLEQIRAKNDMDRQTALETMRQRGNVDLATLRHGLDKDTARLTHDLGQEAKLSEVQGPLAEATRNNKLQTAQALLDQENDPDNVAKRVTTATTLDEAKAQSLSPGEIVMRNGQVVGENKRPTYGEAMAGAREAKADDKLPPAYVSAATMITNQNKGIQETIKGLREKSLTSGDLVNNPEAQKRIETEIRGLEQQSTQLALQLHREQINHGLITPDKAAAEVAPTLQTLDDLNRVLTQAGTVSPKWSNDLADAIQRTGVLTRLNRNENDAGEARTQRQDGGISAEPGAERRTGILSGARARAMSGELSAGSTPTGPRIDTTRSSNLLAPDPYGRPTVEFDPEAQKRSDDYFGGVNERANAQIKAEQERMLRESRSILGSGSRIEASRIRTEEIRTITPEVVQAMSPEKARETLAKYGRNGTEIPGPIRRLLEDRAR